VRKKKSHPVADQFSNDEMDQIKRYGQALSGGVTPFDDEVERHLARYDAKRKKTEAVKRFRKRAQTALRGPLGLEIKSVRGEDELPDGEQQ
jgi:hypothetical protein